MNALQVSINAVFPFVVYVTLGYLIRQRGLADEKFMNTLNGIVFRILFPALMFWNMYSIDRNHLPDFRLMGTMAGCMIALVTVLTLLVPRFVRGNPQRGVVIQAIYRSNCMLFALPLAISIYGEQKGSVYGSLMVASVVPILNIAAVIVLEMFNTESGKKSSPGKLINNVMTNPLLDGIIVGLLFLIAGIPLPEAVKSPLRGLSACATPIALIVLGGTLHFGEIRKNLRYLVPGLTLKLIGLPLLVTVVTLLLGTDNVTRFSLFIEFATPVATASYAMAQNMGGDAELASQFVVLSTVASGVTLFIWVFIYASLGLI